MRVRPNIDEETFQSFLADAFAVQESGVDHESLSKIVEIQRSITAGMPDVDTVLQMIAECARKVTHATGIGIALLKSDQLVYQAGSGSATTCVGRHMTALLNVSLLDSPRSEILRVEDAQTDWRIEAEICRQFEARSLLMLPIYEEHTVAGVFSVLFNDAHTFGDREVRTYRLMTLLIEEMMLCLRALGEKRTHTTSATGPHAAPQTESVIRGLLDHMRVARDPTSNPSVGHICRAPETVRIQLRDLGPHSQEATVVQPANRTFLDKFHWNLPAAAIGLALLVVTWNAYDHRLSAPADSSVQQIWKAGLQRVPIVPEELSAVQHPSMPQNVGRGMRNTHVSHSDFRRIQVGENEVDLIAPDVTIRHLSQQPASRQTKTRNKEIDIGEDVTVRYFPSKPGTASQTQVVSAPGQSLEQ